MTPANDTLLGLLLLLEHAPDVSLGSHYRPESRSEQYTHFRASRIIRSLRARKSFSRSSRFASHFPPAAAAAGAAAGAEAAGAASGVTLAPRLYRSIRDWGLRTGLDDEDDAAADGPPTAATGRSMSGMAKPTGGWEFSYELTVSKGSDAPAAESRARG